MGSLVGAEAQSADREPRTVTFQLRPKDSAIIEGLRLDEVVNVAVNGKITSLNISEYGTSLTLEIDSAGLAMQKPEPKKFVDQMDKLKILKS